MCSLILIAILTAQISSGHAFCYIGNPEWKGRPLVEFLDEGQSLLVNWTGVIFNAKGNGRDCTDNFRVKWWPVNQPSNYSLSQLLDATQRTFKVEGLQQGQSYGFQVIAREDKGTLGVDYNRSPVVYLQNKAVPFFQPQENAIESSKNSEMLHEILQRLKALEHQLHFQCQNLPGFGEDVVEAAEAKRQVPRS